jgi:hypothetical protein
MGIKEKVENHPLVWLFGVSFAAYLAGIATLRFIIEFAKMELVSNAEFERLKQVDTVFVDTCKNNAPTAFQDTIKELRKELKASRVSKPKPALQSEMLNSPGSNQAGRDINITNNGESGKKEPNNIDALIQLRAIGDTSFFRARRLHDSDITKISDWLEKWEKDVEREATKVSKVALNKVQTAKRRRNITEYSGRNSVFDSLLDRLEFQIEALNSIIESN